MRLKSIEYVQQGDVLGKAVYDDKCQLLLAKNVMLTDNYIERLQRANIYCVYIEDELSEGIETEIVIPDDLKLKSINAVQKVFNENKNKKNIKLSESKIEEITDIIKEMLDVIFLNQDTLYVMTELMGTDMYTYNHSTEVAILSMLVAKSLGLNGAFIQKIGVGAMLHDIGKMKIPNNLLNKSEELTGEELILMQEHSKYGYDLLKDSDVISPISRQIILLHHEKLNGNGYPFGLNQDEIPVHVRVVTMCDIFNALTSNRAYRKKINIDQALENIRAESIYELDREIYYHLLKVISVYAPGTIVKLSNGENGIVIRENKDAQTRPIIQLINKGKRGEIINLMEDLTLFITETIDL